MHICELHGVYCLNMHDFVILSVIDGQLVAELNDHGGDYEVSDDKTISLTFSLVPVPRAVRVTGLDSDVDKGTLRNYFNSPKMAADLKTPLLIEDIREIHSGSAVIKFRIAEGAMLLHI